MKNVSVRENYGARKAYHLIFDFLSKGVSRNRGIKTCGLTLIFCTVVMMRIVSRKGKSRTANRRPFGNVSTVNNFHRDPHLHSVPLNRRSFFGLSCDWQVSSPHPNSSEHTQNPFFITFNYGITPKLQYLLLCVEVQLGSVKLCQITRSVHFLTTASPFDRIGVSTVRLCRHSRVHRQWFRNAYEVGVVYHFQSVAFHRAFIDLGLRTDMASSSDN